LFVLRLALTVGFGGQNDHRDGRRWRTSSFSERYAMIAGSASPGDGMLDRPRFRGDGTRAARFPDIEPLATAASPR
jgi:hypothetical protein